MTGKATLLDTFAFGQMLPGRYFKVHPYEVQAPGSATAVRIDPRGSNPWSTGRLARRPRHVHEKSSVGMSYVATTVIAALFEALFRDAAILPDHAVYFEPPRLAGWCLSELTLTHPLDIIPADLPDRKTLVIDPNKEARWRWLLSTPHHAMTWSAAIDVANQLHAAGHDFGGITWNSIQFPKNGTVYLLYDPPNGPATWVTDRTTRLDTPRGRAEITRALRAFGYKWLDVVKVDGDVPPPGAL